MKQVNEFRLTVGDTIEFVNHLGYKVKETISRITEKSVFYTNGSRESWNTINYCIKTYNAQITNKKFKFLKSWDA